MPPGIEPWFTVGTPLWSGVSFGLRYPGFLQEKFAASRIDPLPL